MKFCKKYRIEKWLCGKSVVFTPQKKLFVFWHDMIDSAPILGRDFVDSEEKAREIIERDKRFMIESAVFAMEKESVEESFKKEKKIICVE